MKLKLINFSEILVRERIDEMLAKNEVCDCQQCRLDIMAIALNNLPPRYIVSEQGEVFSKANSFTIQTTVDIVGAIQDAIEKVSRKPRH